MPMTTVSLPVLLPAMARPDRRTGWQLLYGCETGLELVNPGNSLLVSVARALELEPKLAPLLQKGTPPAVAAYAYDEASGSFVPAKMPEDIPTQ